MPRTIPNAGDYMVELDAGYISNEFVLNTSTLNGTNTLSGSTLYFDVTEYVTSVQIKRGRDSQDSQFGAGTCTIVIDDLLGQDKFNVANTASPYWNTTRGRLGFEPLKKVRVSRGTDYLFVGFIVGYDTEFSRDGHNMVTVRCADAFLLLATTTITSFTPPAEKSGARVERVLLRSEVGFPQTPAWQIDTGVANLGDQVIDAQTPLAYLNYVQEYAEQGRFFVDRSGNLQWDSRTPTTTFNAGTLFSDNGAIPFETLEVVYE